MQNRYDNIFTREQMGAIESRGFVINGVSQLYRRDKQDSNYGEYEYIHASKEPFVVEECGVFPDGDGGYYEDSDKEKFLTFEELINYIQPNA